VVADFSASPGHGLGHLISVLGLRRGREHAEHLRALVGDAGFDAVEIEATPSRALCILHARKPG
jgi:hypothetical protein